MIFYKIVLTTYIRRIYNERVERRNYCIGVLGMKIKVTRKSIKEKYPKIISVGYCNLQWLLNYEYAFAYSTRAEGWACDYYKVGDTIISTGYAPIGKTGKYDTTREYDDIARNVVTSNMEYDQKVAEVRRILELYIDRFAVDNGWIV